MDAQIASIHIFLEYQQLSRFPLTRAATGGEWRTAPSSNVHLQAGIIAKPGSS